MTIIDKKGKTTTYNLGLANNLNKTQKRIKH